MKSTCGCLVGVLLLSVACVCMITSAKVFSTVRVLGVGARLGTFGGLSGLEN